jgi:hypothetical protein
MKGKGVLHAEQTKEEFFRITHTVAVQVKDRYELLFLLLSV